MKTPIPPQSRRRRAFTLVELLVVMAVIATLAAMLFPAAAAIKKRAIIKRVETEMKFLEAALAAYQGNLGHYPPDNPDAPIANQLFYELSGTKVNGPAYETESGQGRINTADLPTFFGNKVTGFVNVSKGGGDEAQSSKNYLIGLRPAQYLEVERNGRSGIILGVTDKGPLVFNEAASGGRTINPWRYTSGSATNSPGKYDLWIDVLIAGKTNRFCNWSEKPLLVNDY
jgi:prepilin-type N-terminal cleavage/methylation domain-containing protein